MFEDVFIAIYTHRCKSYCDDVFFNNLFSSDIGSASVSIVDNSPDIDYYHELYEKYGHRAYVDHIVVDRGEKRIQFMKNVEASLYGLRRKFLDGPYDYFVILESDVAPKNKKWLHYFMEVVDQADIIGGLYYDGFHTPEMWQGEPRLVPVMHALSGCTLYKRELLERFNFRSSGDNPHAFPDAWMSLDAREAGFRIANYTKIQCAHLTDNNGGRGIENIN